MSSSKVLFGFHAVGVRLKTAPKSVIEIYFDPSRRDARMRQFLDKANEAGTRLIESDGTRLAKLCGGHGHQGVAARVHELAQITSLDELLEQLEASQAEKPEAERVAPLILVLDGVTDPHNLGACLRTADAAGALAVIVPKDKSATLNATVRKVACGAAEVIPLVAVTNLARSLEKLQQRGIWIVGTAGEAEQELYAQDLTGPIALVMGAEGKGMRRLTREHCDYLVRLPMAGSVSSLNVSVATGVCLFEALRQRSAAATRG